MNAVVPTNKTDVARRSPPPLMPVLRPQTFGELRDFAMVAARSGMVPQTYQNKPDAIIIAVQMGSELGLSPMQALSNIAVVNGRPSVWGDAMPGLCRQSAVCDDIEEWFEGDGETLTAHCRATRVGKKPIHQQFGVSDAKKASLWAKAGPWTQYPRRMLQMRARGFALRDAFPDVLRGLISYEEAMDIPRDSFQGTTVDATYTVNSVIGDEVPERVMNAPEAPKAAAPAQPRQSPVRKWLDGLHADLSSVTDEDGLHAIENDDAVKDALNNMRNGDLAELKAMLAETFDRVRAMREDAGDEMGTPDRAAS